MKVLFQIVFLLLKFYGRLVQSVNQCPPSPSYTLFGSSFTLQVGDFRIQRFDDSSPSSLSTITKMDRVRFQIYKGDSSRFQNNWILVNPSWTPVIVLFQFAKVGDEVPHLQFYVADENNDGDDLSKTYQDAKSNTAGGQDENEDSWYLAAVYFYEVDQPLLKLTLDQPTTQFSTGAHFGGNGDITFLCEDVQFDLVSEVDGLRGLAEFKNLYLRPFHSSPSISGYPLCEPGITSPCDSVSSICQARNGDIDCVAPENSEEFRIPSLNRQEYIDLYVCPNIGEAVDEEKASKLFSSLYWDGGASFLQVDDANITLANGDRYKFNDKYNRKIRLYSGRYGHTIERSSDWEEDFDGSSRQRRIHLKMGPNENSTAFKGVDGYLDSITLDGYNEAQENGWSMYRLYVYAYGPWADSSDPECQNRDDWVYALFEGHDIAVPSADQIFHCDYVEFTLDQRDPDYRRPVWPPGEEEDQANTYGGTISFRDFYVGGFLGENRDNNICDYEIYNPCADNKDGKNKCRAINGIVSCLASDEDSISIARNEFETSISRSAELLCNAPIEEDTSKADDLVGSTMLWELNDKYIFATNVDLVYPDGTALTFQDQLGRDQCLYDYDGSIGREKYWAEGNRTYRMMFEFQEYQDHWSPYRSTVLSNDYYEDLLSIKLGKPYNLAPYYPQPLETRKNSLMFCDYFELEYQNPDTNEVQATFSAHNMVMGAFLRNYDNICDFPISNPCEKTPEFPVCHFIGGKVQCEAKLLVENPLAVAQSNHRSYDAEFGHATWCGTFGNLVNQTGPSETDTTFGDPTNQTDPVETDTTFGDIINQTDLSDTDSYSSCAFCFFFAGSWLDVVTAGTILILLQTL